MITLTEAMESLNAGRVKFFARCWKIVRTDGVIFRFTEHDLILNIAEAGDGAPLFPYDPTGGFDSTAQQKQGNLADHNLEFAGIISSDKITVADLDAGRYDGATITGFLVDWRYPFAGIFDKTVYFITEGKFSGEHFEVRVEGLGRKITQKVGKVFGKNCRHELGDAVCLVVLTDFDDTGAVNTIDTQRRKFNIDGLTTDPVTGIYDYGKIEWTSGDNNLLVSEIKTQTRISATEMEVEIQLDTKFDLVANDTCRVIQGCNKLKATCKDKFDNIPNHGGFPFIPSIDRYVNPSLDRDN